eukprot:tig00020911_g15727.t1
MLFMIIMITSLVLVLLRVTASNVHVRRSIVHGFSARRVRELAKHILPKGGADGAGLEAKVVDVLARIRVVPVHDVYSFLSALDAAAKACEDDEEAGHAFFSGLRLVVVDMLSTLLSPNLGGQQFQGHALMAHAGALMKRLALQHHVAFVLTNHMVGGGGGGSVLKPALGDSWGHVPSTRLEFSTDSVFGFASNVRCATARKSLWAPAGSFTYFAITERGLCAHAPPPSAVQGLADPEREAAEAAAREAVEAEEAGRREREERSGWIAALSQWTQSTQREERALLPSSAFRPSQAGPSQGGSLLPPSALASPASAPRQILPSDMVNPFDFAAPPPRPPPPQPQQQQQTRRQQTRPP